MSKTTPDADLLGRVEAIEVAYEEWKRCSDEIIRTEDPDPEINSLREGIRQASSEVITGWDLIGRPDNLRESIEALPDFPTLAGVLLADPDSTAAFEEITRDVAQEYHASLTKPESWEDAHVAGAFAEDISDRWLYVADWKRWLVWDGKRWARDGSGFIHEVARQWVLDMGSHLWSVGASAADISGCTRLKSRNRLVAIVEMARHIEVIAATPDEFDRDPDVLCVGNGVVDLRTGTLRPHDPADRITRLAPVDFDPEARHVDFDAALAVVDPEVLPWLQRAFGYAATGHTSDDKVPVLDGGGRNGKSTILEAVAATLGDYAAPVAAQLIMRTKHDHHPTLKADLMGRRLVWVSETEEGGALRMEQVKALTGGDRIKARYMYGNFFDFEPSHTLFVATNHRPLVNSTEVATWSRLRLVPFPYTYSADPDEGDPYARKIDTQLRHRLKLGKAQRQAALAWLVEGARRWHELPLVEDESRKVTAATDMWRASEDVIYRFIEERVTFDPTVSVAGGALFKAYQEWCSEEGRPPKSNKNFATEFFDHEEVKAHGVEKRTARGRAMYAGLSLLAGDATPTTVTLRPSKPESLFDDGPPLLEPAWLGCEVE